MGRFLHKIHNLRDIKFPAYPDSPPRYQFLDPEIVTDLLVNYPFN